MHGRIEKRNGPRIGRRQTEYFPVIPPPKKSDWKQKGCRPENRELLPFLLVRPRGLEPLASCAGKDHRILADAVANVWNVTCCGRPPRSLSLSARGVAGTRRSEERPSPFTPSPLIQHFSKSPYFALMRCPLQGSILRRGSRKRLRPQARGRTETDDGHATGRSGEAAWRTRLPATRRAGPRCAGTRHARHRRHEPDHRGQQTTSMYQPVQGPLQRKQFEPAVSQSMPAAVRLGQG
jgi:hypothetical protein